MMKGKIFLTMGWLCVVLIGSIGSIGVHAQNLPNGYLLVELGTLGGDSSAATAIDEQNTAVGWSDSASGERHAFVQCQGCEMQDAGALPGGTLSTATAISANGAFMAGHSEINEHGASFKPVTQGFVINGKQMRQLGALYCPCDFNTRYGSSEAHAVNDLGHVAGHSETVRGAWVSHAFLWKDGQMHRIGDEPGDRTISRAFGINNSSQVVGDFAEDEPGQGVSDLPREAFLWTQGSRQALGVLPGHVASSALSINNQADVVGWSSTAQGATRAFLWQDNRMRDLGVLSGDDSSFAVSINDAGQIVGWSASMAGGSSRPFLWQSGVMLDLNSLLSADPEWTLIEVTDINNQGWISGSALRNGHIRAVVLQPL